MAGVNENGVAYADSVMKPRCGAKIVMGDFRGDVTSECELVSHIPEVMHEAVLDGCKPVGHLRWKDS